MYYGVDPKESPDELYPMKHAAVRPADELLLEPAPRAGVLLPLPLPGAYDYKLPKGTSVRRGLLVTAPLGPREQLGVVWGEAEGSVGDNRLREAVPLEGSPTLPEKLCDLVDWVAQYTLVPAGMVLSMALRSGRAFEPETLRVAYVLGPQTPKRLTPARQRVLDIAKDGLARSVPALADEANASSAVVRGLIESNALIAIELPEFERFSVPNPDFAPVELNESQGRAAGAITAGVTAAKFTAL
jgi:primosomal protein N' (replication factor Y)